MIYTNVPYCPKELGKDLGKSYNMFMERLQDDDWACFLDHDAMFTTKNWYHQLEDIIEKFPDIGLFSCLTNRIANPMQKPHGIDQHNHDIQYHRNIGKTLQSQYYDTVHVEDKLHGWLMSGVIILISKRTWKRVGGFKSGFLGVDNDMHEKCIDNDIKIGIMNGVYVYHWYRGDGDMSHLGK